MNVTEKVYKNRAKIQYFEDKWFNIDKKEYITYLYKCKEFFIDNNDRFEADEDSLRKRAKEIGFNYFRTPLEQLVLELDNSNKEATEDLKNIIDIIEECFKESKRYLIDLKYNITLPQLGEILDLDETYISRTILDYFDYFELNNISRFCFKNSKDFNISNSYINKKIFISIESIKSFIRKHIKYTDDRKRINMFLGIEKTIVLSKLYKSGSDLRAAMIKIIQDVEMEVNNDLKRAVEEKKPKNTRDYNKIRRANQPLNNIPDEWVNLILDQIVNLKSIKSIKKELNSYNAGLQKASEFNVLNINTLDANFKSVNDTQIYYLLDKYMDYKRFVMIDVDTPNMKNETENSQAAYVRYAVGIDMLREKYFENEKKISSSIFEYDYDVSIDSKIYDYMTDGVPKDQKEERLKEVFYNRLLNKAVAIE